MGHTTRCIPIIKKLSTLGYQVYLAGNSTQKRVLTGAFPELPFLLLNGYNIRYAKYGHFFGPKILFQIFRIKKAVKAENLWLNEMVNLHNFNTVISDNRYGLYHHNTKSIIITHQLNIKSPFGKLSEKFLNRLVYKYINRFSLCWVPDYESENNNLAGVLSHPKKKPGIPVYYAGPLSRFEYSHKVEEKKRVLIILSGPEPQRTILENFICKDAAGLAYHFVLARGAPGEEQIIPSAKNIVFFNHLDTPALQKEIEKAEYIICRSGYSSIMDLLMFKKKIIMIPTPGQPEQEYLGKLLSEKKLAVVINQKKISVKKALENADEFDFNYLQLSDNHLDDVIEKSFTEK